MDTYGIVVLAARLGLALLAATLAFFAAEVFKTIRAAWMLRRIPSPPGTWLGGHVNVLSSLTGHLQVQNWAHSFGGFFKLRTFWRQMVIVADPVLFDELTRLERQGVLDKPGMILGPAWGQTEHFILSEHADNPLWKLVRKGVAPAFNTGNMRTYHHHVVYVMDCLIKAIKGKGPEAVIDISDVAQRESFDVIGKVGFGTDFGSRENITRTVTTGFADGQDIFSVFTEFSEEANRLGQNPLRKYLTFLPEVKAGQQSWLQMEKMSLALLKEVKLRMPLAPDDKSIAAHLLRLIDPATRQMLTDARLAREFLAFLFAGSETTGHTIAWTLYEVVRHPEVMAKLEAELDAAGLLATPERPDPRAFTYADIQLPYLQAVIKESMRLRTVVSYGYRRVAKRDIRLSNGAVIPRGTTILGSALASMTSPSFWGGDADQFVPERWEGGEDAEYMERPRPTTTEPAETSGESLSTSEESGSRDRVRKFHPFGDGQRSCVGMNLARTNVPTALAMLLCNFRFELDESVADKQAEELGVLGITLRFKDGLPMRCKPRVPVLEE